MDITSEQIKSARERRQMTQQELADEVGVSLRTVGSWERGESVPRNRMGAVAEALGLEVPGARDYGQEAIKRRLGILGKERREQMGLGRIAFKDFADLGSDSTVQQFEFGQRWPRPQTLRKLETALGWRYRVMDELLEDPNRAASSVTFADLDKPAEQPAPRPLSAFSTAELMREVASRMEALQAGLGASTEQHHYDLAASDDHVEGEDDND